MNRESMSSQSSLTMDEANDYLLEKDVPLPRVSATTAKRPRSWIHRSCVLLSVNLVLLISAISIWAHVHTLLQNFSCDGITKQDHFEPDLLYDSPVTFQPHKFYGGPPSNETDEMWMRLSPPGDGIVELPNEFTTHLPVSLPSPHNPSTHKVYGVSMFHQLHCLNFLRFAYYPEAIEDMAPWDIAAHRDHCLDFIRQAIMCNGDSTFEPLTAVGINGMGAIHQCRNFERIFSWAYDHRSDKINGSGYKGGVVTHTPGHRNSFNSEGMEDDHH